MAEEQEGITRELSSKKGHIKINLKEHCIKACDKGLSGWKENEDQEIHNISLRKYQ